jgi:hypothetical protein
LEHYSHVPTGAQRSAAKKLDSVFMSPEAAYVGHSYQPGLYIGHDWPQRAVSQTRFKKQKTSVKPYVTDV